MKRISCLFLMIISIALPIALYGRTSQKSGTAGEKIYEPKEVDQKAKILKRQEPQYTDQARRNRTSGTVILKVILKASGEIGEIKVISGLADGLTEECMRVARLVKFEPAVKNGIAVSQYSRFQYFFYDD